MADRFPVERAAETVQHLAGSIGLRIPGQPGFQRALSWLRQELESIPGWEVDLQEAAASLELRKMLIGTCHVNLVARFRGEETGAILVNAHLDSPASSVGAADDGAAVAVMLEAARLIANGPRPRRSLIFLFNGSEESYLQGAVSFCEQHPWAKDVAAFINLEAAGCKGPFTLFQASPKLPALLRAYRSVAHPSGSVLAQDLFESSLVPNETDYRIFASHGLHGMDIALTGDGYAYHNWCDQPERLSLATLREMGDTLMSLLRRLDRAQDLAPRAEPAPSVYFDLCGRAFITYPKRFAPVLMLLAALLGAYVVWGLPWWMGLLRQLGVALAALLLPAGAAWVMGKLTRFDLWWYAHPAPTGIGWTALALAGMAAVQALVPLPTPTAMAGALVFWLLLGAAAVAKRIGSACFATAWAISGAVGLLLWPVSPLAAVVVAAGGGTLASASAFVTMIRFFLAHLGRNPFPSHIMVGVLFGLGTLAALAFVPLPTIVVWTALAITVAALAVAALLPAVTPARPEMLNVTDLWQAGGSHRLYFPSCRQFSPAIRRQLTGTFGTLEATLWKRHLRAPKAGVAVPLAAALSPDVAAPAVTIVRDERGEQRRITVRCVSAGYALVLSTDVQPLQVTIDAGNGRPLMHGRQDRVRFVNPPPEGILVTFSLPAGTACRLIASSWYLPDEAPEFPPSTSVLYQKAAAIEIAL